MDEWRSLRVKIMWEGETLNHEYFICSNIILKCDRLIKFTSYQQEIRETTVIKFTYK